ncbi:homoserine/homoserine lactone efflux protein [compost metagenome]
MQWAGVAWLTYLAWQIFRAPAAGVTTQKAEERLGLLGAASLQWINPKTWMMALAVVSVFAGAGEDRLVHVINLSWVFFLVSLPCLGVWALLGAGASRWLRSPRAMQRFNRCMGLVLLGSAWLSVLA